MHFIDLNKNNVGVAALVANEVRTSIHNSDTAESMVFFFTEGIKLFVNIRKSSSP